MKQDYYYALIVDCEGNKANRCREIGIVSVLISKDNYIVEKEYINYKKENPIDILKRAYGDIIQKNKQHGIEDTIIPIFAFGSYDEFLIRRKLEVDKGKFRSTINERFVFIDMQKIITQYLKDKKFRFKYSKSLSLKTTTKFMNANLVLPSHNALADSKTLSNIMIEYNKENSLYDLIINELSTTKEFETNQKEG